MKPASIALVALLFASSLFSAPAAIDRAGAAVKGMEAQFTHSFTPKGFKKAQVESGTVIFGSLPQMRWSYTRPEAKVFVFDGTRSWFYVPADRQVTTADIDERRKSELPFLLVGDAAARGRHFAVREQQRGNFMVTTLQPRVVSGPIRTVSISTDVSSNRISSIEYLDRDGNRTLFSFSGYHPARVDPGTFSFTAPAGVQVVKAD